MYKGNYCLSLDACIMPRSRKTSTKEVTTNNGFPSGETAMEVDEASSDGVSNTVSKLRIFAADTLIFQFKKPQLRRHQSPHVYYFTDCIIVT